MYRGTIRGCMCGKEIVGEMYQVKTHFSILPIEGDTPH